jgi:hypothetical protein
MRLTNYMRDKTLAAILCNMFDAKKAELQQEVGVLHIGLVEDALGKDAAKFKAAPQNWFSRQGYFYVEVKATSGATANDRRVGFEIRVPDVVQRTYLLEPDCDLALFACDLFDRIKQLEQDRKDFSMAAYAILHSCGTVEKLLIAWPGLLEALGDEEFFAPAPPKPQLPAVQFETITAMLEKYPPANDAASEEAA